MGVGASPVRAPPFPCRFGSDPICGPGRRVAPLAGAHLPSCEPEPCEMGHTISIHVNVYNKRITLHNLMKHDIISLGINRWIR